MFHLWKPGDIIAWRGVFRNRVWSVLTVIVVKDTREETVLTLLPGAECMTEKDNAKGKKNGHRRWDFKDKDWELETYFWRANRLLLLLAPQRYYSTIYFWNDSSNEFLCYYINFQLPFQRTPSGINTLDLELDLIINADFSHEWKDLDDFKKATEHEIISPEWTHGIENAKPEIFDQLKKRQYPFDGSWLDWRPDPRWSSPPLPENWDKI
jgi:uncharacterized protein DUF402